MMILINTRLSTDRGYFSGLPGQSVSSASVSVNKELKMKKSTVMEAIKGTINDYVNKWNDQSNELFIEHGIEFETETAKSLGILIRYSNKSIFIDGDFLAQVREYEEDGNSEFNYLYKLWLQINSCVEDLGFYLEYYGYGQYDLAEGK